MLGYSSQIRLVSCFWLQGRILITSVHFSIAENELRWQFTSFELSGNEETISICLRLFVAENDVWYGVCLPFAHFSDRFYYNLVKTTKKTNIRIRDR